MNEAKHTPGPWAVYESNAIVGEKLDDHPIWLRPVIARFATGVRQSDALMMAAAPDLLEALQAALDYGRMTGASWVEDKAIAAIAKATGK